MCRLEEALFLAGAISEEIRTGKYTFDQAAKIYSDCPSGQANSGNLGTFPANRMDKDFNSDVVLGIVHIENKNFPHGYIRTALGAFYNHSDEPNCKNTEGFWHQLPVKYLVTIKPIKAGDELTANYTLYRDFDEKGE